LAAATALASKGHWVYGLQELDELQNTDPEGLAVQMQRTYYVHRARVAPHMPPPQLSAHGQGFFGSCLVIAGQDTAQGSTARAQ